MAVDVGGKLIVDDEDVQVAPDVSGKLSVDNEDVEVAVHVDGKVTVDGGDVEVAVDVGGKVTMGKRMEYCIAVGIEQFMHAIMKSVYKFDADTRLKIGL